jgi:hypothetical protein
LDSTIRGQEMSEDAQTRDTVHRVRCPKCGSGACRTAEATYLSGTRDNTHSFGGVGIGTHGAADVFAGQSNGVSASRLAQYCAPPQLPPEMKRSEYHGWLVFAVVASWLLWAVLLFIVGCAIDGNSNDETAIDVCITLSFIAGPLTGWWYVRKQHGWRYGWRWIELATKHRDAMAIWQSMWLCSQCLHAWQHETPLGQHVHA